MFAYLDPGTGSVIVQALIGGGVAIAVLVKAYWHKIVTLFGGKKDGKSEDLRK